MSSSKKSPYSETANNQVSPDMIANISKRPFLRVGKYCITSYGDEWLERALEEAAKNIGGDVSPFRQDLIAGIMHYLEETCTTPVLPVEILYQKVRNMLHCIGLGHFADSLPVIAPNIAIDLSEIAVESPFPLFFFHSLRQELQDLRGSGVDCCAFSGLKKCVMDLERSRRWSPRCEQTAHEILGVINDTWGIYTR